VTTPIRVVIIGHVGFEQSITAVAAGLGWRLDEVVAAPPGLRSMADLKGADIASKGARFRRLPRGSHRNLQLEGTR
jgi:hypothetical protein